MLDRMTIMEAIRDREVYPGMTSIKKMSSLDWRIPPSTRDRPVPKSVQSEWMGSFR
jgi:hypothetical protein